MAVTSLPELHACTRLAELARLQHEVERTAWAMPSSREAPIVGRLRRRLGRAAIRLGNAIAGSTVSLDAAPVPHPRQAGQPM